MVNSLELELNHELDISWQDLSELLLSNLNFLECVQGLEYKAIIQSKHFAYILNLWLEYYDI